MVYFVVFGFQGEPFLELNPVSTSGRIKVFRDKMGMIWKRDHHVINSRLKVDNFRHLSNWILFTGLDSKCRKCATRKQAFTQWFQHETPAGRFQLDLQRVLRNFYTLRIYSGNSKSSKFHPPLRKWTLFFQSALHFEASWVGRHVMLVWFGCCTIYVNQCFPGAYVHLLHRCASYLGSWTRIEGRVSPAFYNVWSSNVSNQTGKSINPNQQIDISRCSGLSLTSCATARAVRSCTKPTGLPTPRSLEISAKQSFM